MAPRRAEIAVGLLQLEGIEVPVLALGLHHIEMGEKEKRPAHAGAAQSRHQIPLARPRGQNLDVRGRKAAVAQSRRHGLGRAQRVAGGLGGVDLDQLTVDVEKRPLVRRQRLRGGRARQPADERADDDRCKHAQSQMKWHRSTLLARADHVDPACGSLRRKAAILASSCSPAKSSSRRQLRLVARGIHHAEKAERLAAGGAKLVPGHRRHGDEIAGLDRLHFAADQAMAAPAQDQHGVHVLVPFKGRKAVGRHLEIAQLRVHLRIGEQHLPGDRLEQGAVVFLVRKLLDAFPAVILRLAVDRSVVASP